MRCAPWSSPSLSAAALGLTFAACGGAASAPPRAAGAGPTVDAGPPAVVGSAAATASAAPAPVPVSVPPVAGTVTVDRRKSQGRLEAGFAGFSFEKTNLTNSFFTGDNAALIALFKLLGPGLLRIGANDVDHSTWRSDASPAGPGRTSLEIGRADVEALAAFLAATGWRVIYSVSMKGTAASAVEEARYVTSKLGAKLHSLEIGNEINYFPNNAVGTPISQWEPFEAAIRKVLPAARFAGPAAAGAVVEFTLPFVDREGSKIALLTEHYYKGAAASHPTVADLLAADPSVVTQSDALAKAARVHRIAEGYRWDEMNSYSGHGAPGVSDAFAAALWGIDFMLTTAEHGATGVNFHGGGQNMDGNECPAGPASCTKPFVYSPIREVDSRVTAVGPLFYAMLYVSRLGPGTLLPATARAEGLALQAYAVALADGSLNVALVDMDAARDVDVTLDLGGPVKSAEVLALRAPSLSATSGFTFAGAGVTAEGEWAAQPQASLEVAGGVVRTLVPAGSAILVHAR
jgi:hypothetical protein